MARTANINPGLAVDVALTGAPELERALKNLSEVTRKKVIATATSRALTPIRAEARRNAPVRTGALRADISKKVKKYRSGNVWGAVGIKKHYLRTSSGHSIYMRDHPSNYVHLVEFGTVHSPARPFLRNALRNNRGQALQILRDTIRSAIEKARKKGLR